jgi:hypothetical protein
MKIGIDIHGTIDWDPEFWRQTIPLLQALGHTIHIVSGPEEEKIMKRLEELGINYGSLYLESVADYIKEKSLAKDQVNFWYDENRDFWTTDKIWWAAKAEICRDREIDVMIDDQSEYFIAGWKDTAPNTAFILYQKGRFVCAPKT